MNRRTYLKNALALSAGLLIPAGIVSVVGRQGISDSTDLVGFDGKVMGTSFSVRLGSAHNKNTNQKSQPTDQQRKALAHQVHTTLLDVDRRMSTWRDSSELSLFNNSTDQDWYPVSPDTLSVIDRSLKVSKMSLGAFDVSVGPLVDLWGFGATSQPSHSAFSYSKPSNKAIAECMSYVGYHAIDIDLAQQSIRKRTPEAKLDLSGIAKGFAVDKVAECLDMLGYENYLVEVGGELRSRGQRFGGQDWRVAIERPGTATRDVLRVLNLNNSAIATSGDYRNFYMDGGQQYSHSIDPRAGRPVNHELVSVSVIAKTTMLADALSTALIILGPDDAQALAKRHQIAAHFILKSTSGALDEQFSPSFSGYIT